MASTPSKMPAGTNVKERLNRQVYWGKQQPVKYTGNWWVPNIERWIKKQHKILKGCLHPVSPLVQKDGSFYVILDINNVLNE